MEVKKKLVTMKVAGNECDNCGQFMGDYYGRMFTVNDECFEYIDFCEECYIKVRDEMVELFSLRVNRE